MGHTRQSNRLGATCPRSFLFTLHGPYGVPEAVESVVSCLSLQKHKRPTYSEEHVTRARPGAYMSFPLEDMLVPGNEHKHTLYAVVVHHGRAFNQGHYTSICRVGDEWYEFNDHLVKRVNENYVASVEAYLLVYERDESHEDVGALEVLIEQE